MPVTSPRILNDGKDSEDVFTQLMAIQNVKRIEELDQLKLEHKLSVGSGFSCTSNGYHDVSLRAKFVKEDVAMLE
jgi:hypothetical protein